METFEDKVKDALHEVMRHAIAGHDDSAYTHSFCVSADHALHILAESGVRPVNDAVATRVLSNLDKAQ